jgi:hypothetical protein
MSAEIEGFSSLADLALDRDLRRVPDARLWEMLSACRRWLIDDMHLAARLVEGMDVWINTPRRPWEACGRSGMKGELGSPYRAQVPAARPVTDYTPRVIPCYDGVAVPLEEARIQWQR